MRPRLITGLALCVLLATFFVDALTPQTLVIAIVLAVPIALAALTQSRRLTSIFVLLSIAADIGAGWINARREGYWSQIGTADRILSLFSLIVVGILCTMLQERARFVGQLALKDERAKREAMLANASARIRKSLSSELVTRAIVKEAFTILKARTIWWHSNGLGETLYTECAKKIQTAPTDANSPEILSVTRKAIDDEQILHLTPYDALSRLILDRFSAQEAIVVPVRDRSETFGALVAVFDEPVDDERIALAHEFAELAQTALAQAKLFDELARRNEALIERQEVIRDLVYALSHDLRTPLTALSLTLRQAQEGAYGEFRPEYREVLAASLSSIDELRRLAETLLLVARIEAGEHRTQPEVCDLRTLAKEVVHECEAMALHNQIELRAEGVGAPVYIDRADLRRAITNLVANAIAHTPAGGRVIVSTKQSDADARLEVVDNGFGVSAELQPYLFQRFSGGHAGSGSGLGLYLVRRIAEQYQGKAGYQPALTRGSVFFMKFPSLPEHS